MKKKDASHDVEPATLRTSRVIAAEANVIQDKSAGQDGVRNDCDSRQYLVDGSREKPGNLQRSDDTSSIGDRNCRTALLARNQQTLL